MIGTLSLVIIFMRLVGRPRRQAGCRSTRQLFINSLDFVHVPGSTITSKDKDGNFHEIRKITARLNSQPYTMPYYETADRIESAIRCQHGQNWGPARSPNDLYSASTPTETVPKCEHLKDGNGMNASRVQRALCAQQAILLWLSRFLLSCLYCRLYRQALVLLTRKLLLFYLPPAQTNRFIRTRSCKYRQKLTRTVSIWPF